ncbi:glucose-6-phosphate dehydrogenase [Ascoidea rubescens DSM 1968]|uniref:Glucose-6-phosphate 1-dehydrogenase n=1 Tax=Ascoidea rubescens DSM 1968 TaxID=1344418 RepID=A0A1D2VHL4_9ASCO|nr:glucose-6-phosphate dehydrogenase [Ascoidea rubescens DSM 1968]ODV61126.1 glucose-6-phosphate dehydrogenase [Ascoidea rubescens DSM 1968]
MVRAVFKDHCAIVVFGASGDLAKKKTFPALFGLYLHDELPKNIKIFGYARTSIPLDDFKSRIASFIKYKKSPISEQVFSEKKEKFLTLIDYLSGPYDKNTGFKELESKLLEFDSSLLKNSPSGTYNTNDSNKFFSQRLYYLALPPSAFVDVARNLKENNYPEKGTGFAKIIVEKPFGHDLPSARELQSKLAPLWSEDELYRIDHYLGKEMVKNLLVLRFGNEFFGASWSRKHISSIQISFKEPFGTEGRGGYFDKIGIIRDVIQNHLLQVLTLLTIDRPISFDPEAIRDEKVKLLKSISPIDLNDILIAQYDKSLDGTKPSYLDDKTVDPNSKCVTYAAIPINIENERWDGVPIILRAGKALNDGKVEIRIQFKQVARGVFKNIDRNELVIKIQPKEVIYLKINAKLPGLATSTTLTDLDLSYDSRYESFWIPEAYESLIRDCLHDDHSNFVRDDELEVSWKLFTPLLNYLEGPDGPAPVKYPYGARSPPGLDKFLNEHNYKFTNNETYQWPVIRPENL